jgi:hypothetical protein
MKAKVLDGGISDQLPTVQRLNNIVVCNLQITSKFETFYVDMGNQEGDSAKSIC